MANIQDIIDELRNVNAVAAQTAQTKVSDAIGTLRQDALELCWQIEKCGCSDELTKASVMAAKLQTALNELLP